MPALRACLFAAAVLGAISGSLAAGQPAQRQRTNSLRSMSGEFQALVERVRPAVVQIVTSGFVAAGAQDGATIHNRSGSGSGVIVHPEGYVVTNAHVIGSMRRIDVVLPAPAGDRTTASVLHPTGKLVPATVVGMDREADIAVLKVDAKNLASLQFADSEQLQQGHLVFAFGSPFGLENSVTMGVVSSIARQVRPDDPMIYIQTDTTINPGSSGGPLVDADGHIVGINTFIVSQPAGGSGVGFAVPSNIARTVYQQIRQQGFVRRGQIGVQLQTITPQLAEALELKRDWGVLVADVTPDSAAHRAGLEVRDIVLTMNGKTMENARQFGVNIYQNAGKTVSLEILRGSEKRKLDIAVLERPRDPDRLLAHASDENNVIPRLGILAVDLNEQITPLLPPLRKLSGVVVAGIVSQIASQSDTFNPGDVIYAINNSPVKTLAELKTAVASLKSRQSVAVQIERLGQLQFLLFQIN
jgi:serine protease Do